MKKKSLIESIKLAQKINAGELAYESKRYKWHSRSNSAYVEFDR